MKGENEIVPEKDENKYFYSYIDESGKIEIMLFEKSSKRIDYDGLPYIQ